VSVSVSVSVLAAAAAAASALRSLSYTRCVASSGFSLIVLLLPSGGLGRGTPGLLQLVPGGIGHDRSPCE
jgi:hypothetical protein